MLPILQAISDVSFPSVQRLEKRFAREAPSMMHACCRLGYSITLEYLCVVESLELLRLRHAAYHGALGEVHSVRKEVAAAAVVVNHTSTARANSGPCGPSGMQKY